MTDNDPDAATIRRQKAPPGTIDIAAETVTTPDGTVYPLSALTERGKAIAALCWIRHALVQGRDFASIVKGTPPKGRRSPKVIDLTRDAIAHYLAHLDVAVEGVRPAMTKKLFDMPEFVAALANRRPEVMRWKRSAVSEAHRNKAVLDWYERLGGETVDVAAMASRISSGGDTAPSGDPPPSANEV